MRRNLLIVRAGDESVHHSWIQGRTLRNFDLMISYYGTQPDRYRDDADHYHVMTGPRWPAHDAMCRTRPELIGRYDYVGFACDDLGADCATWNKLFNYCKSYALDLAQPAIRGYRSYDITRPRLGCILRFTNFIEVMCPVFSKRALKLLSASFGDSVSGWGLGVAWWAQLGKDPRIAIIDQVRIRHTRPIGDGTLYSVLRRLGVDAGGELSRIKAQYGEDNFKPLELSRMMMPLHGTLRKIFPWPYR